MIQIDQTIFRDAPQQISGRLRRLFEQAPHAPLEPVLLHQQPVKQRQLFIRRAIEDGRLVFAQLLPVNGDGHRVNVHATVKKLTNDRFLFQAHNLSYVVHFTQINYIASL